MLIRLIKLIRLIRLTKLIGLVRLARFIGRGQEGGVPPLRAAGQLPKNLINFKHVYNIVKYYMNIKILHNNTKGYVILMVYIFVVILVETTAMVIMIILLTIT